MYVLITYKDEKNQMKNEGARVVKNIIQLYFRRSSAAYSVIGGWLQRIIKLIEAFTGVIVTCKTEEDPFKNKGARVVTKDLTLKVHADFL